MPAAKLVAPLLCWHGPDAAFRLFSPISVLIFPPYIEKVPFFKCEEEYNHWELDTWFEHLSIL